MHGVDVAPLGGDVRVEQPLGVVGLERRPLLRRRPPLQDRRRLAGAHHGQLGPRPGEADVVAHRLGVHDDVRPAVALAQDHADPRHGRPAVGEHELGAVADHAPPLEVLAGVEAGRVDEREERQVEGVAERDEAGAPSATPGCRACRPAPSAGWRRCRSVARRSWRTPSRRSAPSARGPRAGCRRRRSPRPPCGRRSCRSTSAGSARPPRGTAGRPGRRVGQRRRLVVDALTGGRRAGRRRRRRRPPRSATTRLGTPVWRASSPAPPSSSVVTRTPVNSSTITGPLTKP